MDANKRIAVSIFIVMVLVLMISGCATYGTLQMESRSPYRGKAEYNNRMTIDKLVGHWQDYDVYYAGYKASRATGVLFDPKNDNRKLTNGWWQKINDKETLMYVLKWLGLRRGLYSNSLYKMIGPDGQFYGYVYTPFYHLVFKSVGNETMYVYNLDNPTWNWVY